jgi:hypothetical protein
MYWSSCKIHVIFSEFPLNLERFDRNSKNSEKVNTIKMRPVYLFRADRRIGGKPSEGQTDRQKNRQRDR